MDRPDRREKKRVRGREWKSINIGFNWVFSSFLTRRSLPPVCYCLSRRYIPFFFLAFICLSFSNFQFLPFFFFLNLFKKI